MLKTIIAGWLGIGLTFAALDLLWLGVIAKSFYNSQLGALRADDVNIPAAVVFYLIFVSGILFFAVMPGVRSGSLWTAILYGAALGFLCYATYDLTNLATLRNWPLPLSLVDIAWGTVLTATASAGGFLAWRWIEG